MRVKELISELQKYDSDLDIMIFADGEYWYSESNLLEPIVSYMSGSDLPDSVFTDDINCKEDSDTVLSRIRENGFVNIVL